MSTLISIEFSCLSVQKAKFLWNRKSTLFSVLYTLRLTRDTGNNVLTAYAPGAFAQE